jgi:hypothetical protein
MNYYRSLNSSTVFVWIALLSVALLVTQNLQFHIHDLDHHPGQTDHHASTIAPLVEHEHTDLMHLSIDSSHADHHDSVIVETDAGLDRIFQQLSSKHGQSTCFLFAWCCLFCSGRYFEDRQYAMPAVFYQGNDFISSPRYVRLPAKAAVTDTVINSTG